MAVLDDLYKNNAIPLLRQGGRGHKRSTTGCPRNLVYYYVTNRYTKTSLTYSNSLHFLLQIMIILIAEFLNDF